MAKIIYAILVEQNGEFSNKEMTFCSRNNDITVDFRQAKKFKLKENAEKEVERLKDKAEFNDYQFNVFSDLDFHIDKYNDEND